MTGADLEALGRAKNWDRKTLGLELGVSQDRLRRMIDGRVRIPRHIALACTALWMDLRPFGEFGSPAAR